MGNTPEAAVEAGAQVLVDYASTGALMTTVFATMAEAVLSAASERVDCPAQKVTQFSPTDTPHWKSCVCGGSGSLFVLRREGI